MHTLDRFPRVSSLVAAACFCSMVVHAQDLSGRLAEQKTIVCAHRGWLNPGWPENSLRTMQATERRGPFMLEMDLAVPSDGRIVLMHDKTIDRTTEGHGAVRSMTAAYIQRSHLRAFGRPPTDEAPPLFGQVLAWSHADPQALLMLDIKATPPSAVMPQVRQAGMTDRVLLLTFDRSIAAAAFAADPDVLVSVLVKTVDDLAFYETLSHGRRFAAYIPIDRSGTLFARARAEHEIVITDLLDPKNAFAERATPVALQSHPADILVTNHPVETAAQLQ